MPKVIDFTDGPVSPGGDFKDMKGLMPDSSDKIRPMDNPQYGRQSLTTPKMPKGGLGLRGKSAK